MSYEQRDGDISLFKNDKKTPGSNQPDMRGTMLWKGQKLKISVWTKGEGDRKFLSGKVEPDNYVPGQAAPAQAAPPVPQQSEPEDDSLPF